MRKFYFLDKYNKPMEVTVPDVDNSGIDSILQKYLENGCQEVSQEEFQEAVRNVLETSKDRQDKRKLFLEAKREKVKLLKEAKLQKDAKQGDKNLLESKIVQVYKRIEKRNKLLEKGMELSLANMVVDLPEAFPEMSPEKPCPDGKTWIAEALALSE
jgi:hypothetical protein